MTDSNITVKQHDWGFTLHGERSHVATVDTETLGADLRGADLRGADLRDAWVSPDVSWLPEGWRRGGNGRVERVAS